MRAKRELKMGRRGALLAPFLAAALLAAPAAGGRCAVVVGCSGNVGRLVTNRLAGMDEYAVRGVARSREKAAARFEDVDVELFEADTRDGGSAGLRDALTGADTLVITTGTTAFPTKAWKGGNTPQEVDDLGVRNVVDAWVSANSGSGGAKLQHLVLMSSVGVTRRTEFPFVVLNAAGVLDAKASGEAHVRAVAEREGFDWTVVRPGQLFGGPYDNNVYLGTLLKLDKDQNVQKVVAEKGDRLIGDTLRSTAAEVIVQALSSAETRNTDFTVVNRRGQATTEDGIRSLFASPAFQGDDAVAQAEDTFLPAMTDENRNVLAVGAAVGLISAALAAGLSGVLGSG